MAGNKLGAAKARQKVIELYGKDFYKKIGHKGGSNGTTGGFASDKLDKDGLTGKQRASVAGRIGGINSTRKGIKNGQSKLAQI